MGIRFKLFIICFLTLVLFKVSAQQYSFSTYAFRVYDKDSLICSLHQVNGFNHQWISKIKMDSLSQFEINAINLNDDINYQGVAKHTKGVWILFSENVKKWRPIRSFAIQKREKSGELIVMRIFLNYNYQSCEMPCIFGQSEFKVSDIQFNEGNYIFTDRISIANWKKSSDKIVRIDGDFDQYLSENKIILWDVKMKK